MAAAAAAAAAPKNSPFAPEQPSNIHQIPSKSDSNALFKTLLIIVLVLAIPLFPSQAPDFITQTIFTDFWEIIHLLFIGIAVSYGLFGRRTAQIAPDKFVENSITDDSRSYLSEISHLTSIFDDRYENVCYEHDMTQNYVNYGDQFLENDEPVAHSSSKIRSFAPNDANESVCEGNGNRAWRSQYSKGESLVVVSNAKCFAGGSSDFKPLNLPIRSLRSRDMDDDNQEFKNRNEFSSPKFGGNGNDDGGGGGDAKVVTVRGVVPMNLEKKFEEVAGRATIPWRSRFVRMGDEEEEMSISKLPSHSRPHSVGEFEFEHLKSRSLGGSKFPSTPELRSSKVENLERRRVFAAAHSEVAPIDSEASSSSLFSSSDMDSNGDLDNNIEDSGVEEEVRKGKSLETDAKASSFTKVLPRPKSVRTIKPKRYAVNQKEQGPSRVDGKFRRRFIKSEEDSLIERREEELEIPPVDHHNQEPGRIFSMPKPKPTLPEFHNEEKQDIDDLHSAKTEDTEIRFGKSPDENDTRTNIDNDGELGSEVDRKAGEFIAKFREQIRRQKTSSVEG